MSRTVSVHFLCRLQGTLNDELGSVPLVEGDQVSLPVDNRVMFGQPWLAKNGIIAMQLNDV